VLTINECRKLIDPKRQKYTETELHRMLAFVTELARTVTDQLKAERYEEKSRIDGPRVK
jgi:hypothetical protein